MVIHHPASIWFAQLVPSSSWRLKLSFSLSTFIIASTSEKVNFDESQDQLWYLPVWRSTIISNEKINFDNFQYQCHFKDQQKWFPVYDDVKINCDKYQCKGSTMINISVRMIISCVKINFNNCHINADLQIIFTFRVSWHNI